jgi:hypothetical protein
MMRTIMTKLTKAQRAAADIDSSTIAPAAAVTEPKGKIGVLVAMLRGSDGTTVDAMMAATGWQAHSVRGAMSGALKKTLGLNVVSEKSDSGRVYRIAERAGA